MQGGVTLYVGETHVNATDIEIDNTLNLDNGEIVMRQG
jgi:hypothetical protein